METSLANYQCDLFEIKFFQNRQVIVSKTHQLVGTLIGLNDIEVSVLTDEEINTILQKPITSLKISQNLIERDQICDHSVIYLQLNDGPIGIDLIPLNENRNGVCGGLRVKEILNQNGFEEEDVIIAINGLSIENMTSDKAVEILRATSERKVTVWRQNFVRSQPQRDHKLSSSKSLIIPSDILLARALVKKYDPRYPLPEYQRYVTELLKRFSDRPSYDHIPILDSHSRGNRTNNF